MSTAPAPSPAPSPAPNKARLAHDWIRARIEDGRFPPGYRLVLSTIARELDVSPVPVREAVRLLEAEGLVGFVPNVGAQVAFLHEREYQITMETLALVEGAATAQAAPLLTADLLARAGAVNDEMRAESDPHLLTELNHRFHAVLFEQCPNPHVLDLVHRGWNRLTPLRHSAFAFVPDRVAASVAEHDRLLALLAAEAPPIEIELAVREHRLGTLRAVLAAQAERTNDNDKERT